MIKDIDIVLTPEESAVEQLLVKAAAKKAGVKQSSVTAVKYLRRSIDARRMDIKINAKVRVYVNEKPESLCPHVEFHDVSAAPSAIVVGAGPAGLFASLTLIERGLRPILIERGKDVHERKRDTALLSTRGLLDPESNYAFGEGGAGAYSDGKLYTRSVKRGNVRKVLELLVQHGADESILYETHPHVGTDKLPIVIENIRNTIIASGGEVHFKSRVIDLIVENGETKGVVLADGREFKGPVILATGHSAKDVYQFLDRHGFVLEAKDTAVGVRLEHPQMVIDQLQYHNPKGRGLYLPPASYSFVTQVENRGVYSFCMCPGGSVIPAATEMGRQAVNGMSSSSRGGKKANSGMVVQIRQEDIKYKDKLGMLRWVEEMEEMAYFEGFKAPAQRMADFVNDKVSSTFPDTTYKPGLVSMRMDDALPKIVADSLREGFKAFDRMSRGGFLTNEALMLASETRTSSPVRIVRDEMMKQGPGLYPAGEGAGYAGGIVSAAVDGTEAAIRLSGEVYGK